MEPRDRVRVGVEKVPLCAVCGRSRGEVGTGQGTGETERGVRHWYRIWGTDWMWRPLGSAYGNVPCSRCGLSYNAKWHRRLR